MAVGIEDRRQTARVLVADDTPATTERLCRILTGAGYRWVQSLNRIQRLEQLEGFDVVLLDIVWPSGTRPTGYSNEYFGYTGLQHLKRCSPATRVALISVRLFDLGELAKIAEAEAYFRSDSPPTVVLKTVSALLMDGNRESIGSEGSLVLPDELEATIPISSEEVELLRRLLVLQLSLRDGRPDLFGMKDETYKLLLDGTKEIIDDITKGSKEKSKWKERLQTIATGTSVSKNLFDIIKDILAFLK